MTCIFPPQNQNEVVGAPTCERTIALAAQRKDDQILRTVVATEESPGGPWGSEAILAMSRNGESPVAWNVVGAM